MKKIIATILFVLLAITSASAAELKVDIDRDTKKATISGETGIKRKNQNVLLRILSSGMSESDFYNGTDVDIDDALQELLNVTTDSDGKFSVEKDLTSMEGDFLIIANFFTANEVKTGIISYYSDDVVAAALNDLNTMDPMDMPTRFPSIRTKLGCSDVEFEDIANKSFIYSALIAERLYQSTESVETVFEKALLISQIFGGEYSDNKTLLEEKAGDIGISADILGRYSSIENSNVKKEIFDAVKQKVFSGNIKNLTGFTKSFSENYLLELLLNAGNWSAYESILRANNDIAGLDLSKYDAIKSVSNKNEVMKSLIPTVSFVSIEKLKSDFNNAVEKYSSSGSSGGGGGGSGGGGSSGGGSGSGNSGSNSLGGGGNVSDYRIDTEIIHSASPEIKPIETPDTSFTDIGNHSWAEEAIKKMYNAGVVSGVGDNLFLPGVQVKREEFLKMLIVALDIETDGSKCDFADVDKNSWYYPYVAAAYEKGIVKGISDDFFGTGQNITRQDMAVMAYNAIKFAGLTLNEEITILPFNDDSEIAQYAKTSVAVLRESDIISGVGNRRFAPGNFATRAESVVIVNNIYSKKF